MTVRFFTNGNTEVIPIADVVAVDGSSTVPVRLAIGSFIIVRGRDDSRAVVVPDTAPPALEPSTSAAVGTRKRPRTHSENTGRESILYNSIIGL